MRTVHRWSPLEPAATRWYPLVPPAVVHLWMLSVFVRPRVEFGIGFAVIHESLLLRAPEYL